LDSTPLRQAKFNLAILRFAPLGNIQARHDFEARHQGTPVTGGNALVFQTAAVNTHANDRIGARRIGLNVNVGGAPFVGIDNDLVGQAHYGAVVFAQAADVVVVVVEPRGFLGEFAQDVLDGAELGVAPGGTGE